MLKSLIHEIEIYAKKNKNDRQMDKSGSSSTTQFIARSSANVEDLIGMSDAGLHESFAGLNPFNNVDE